MQDISSQLIQIMNEKKCSSLLAFIEIKDGLYIQQSKPDEKSSRRLRDKRDINPNR
jgi:hypothetical protein